MSKPRQSNTPAIPTLYRFTFTWYEPISCLIGLWVNAFDPDGALDIYVPKEISTRNPAHDMLFSQMAGAYFVFVVIEGILLRYTDDVNVWKIVNAGFLGWDLFLLHGTYGTLSSQGRLDPASWRTLDCVALGLTVSVGLLRALMVLGVGVSADSARSTKGSMRSMRKST
jgi:hypothetical protein